MLLVVVGVMLASSIDITFGENDSSGAKLQVGDDSGSGTSWGGNYPYEKNTILSWNFTWLHRTKDRLFGIT